MSGLNITAQRAREVADAIDAYDEQIKALQDGKRETFASLRMELEDLGLARSNIRDELGALKAAIAKRAKRRDDADAVDERDAMTDSYLDLIERSAPRAAHAIATAVPTKQPSGAGTGSAVRTGAPVSQTTTPGSLTAAQSEAAAGSSPEQGADERTAGEGEAIPVQSAQFVTPTGEGEGLAGSVDTSPAAERPKFARKEHVLRPHCLRPEMCGSYGSKHCADCERAAKAGEDDDEATAIPAFVRKTHDHAIGEQA